MWSYVQTLVLVFQPLSFGCEDQPESDRWGLMMNALLSTLQGLGQTPWLWKVTLLLSKLRNFKSNCRSNCRMNRMLFFWLTLSTWRWAITLLDVSPLFSCIMVSKVMGWLASRLDLQPLYCQGAWFPRSIPDETYSLMWIRRLAFEGKKGYARISLENGNARSKGTGVALLWGKEWGFWIRCPPGRNLDSSVSWKREHRWVLGWMRGTGTLGRTAEAWGDEVQACSLGPSLLTWG